MSNSTHAAEWVLGLASGSALTVGATMHAVQGELAGVPWDKISGTGAAGLVCVVVWFFLGRDRDVRKEHGQQMTERDSTIKAIAHEFSETSTTTAKTFAETMKAADERAERREKEQREWIQRFVEGKA